MDDGKQTKNVERDITRQHIPNFFNVGSIFQSVRIRCRSIWVDIMDRKFMESQPRYVFYCGVIFWTLYLLSEIG